MAERRNGSFQVSRQRHGSDQRGVTAAPRGPRLFDNLKQSQVDKARLRDLARLRREQLKSPPEAGYGNQELPAYRHKHEIINLVNNYKAVILGGRTGSGKSTQVPQFLLEAGYDKIYVMVPRRIIADGLHKRLIEELASHLGDDEAKQMVGVQHGERSEVTEDSKIIVLTPNTFTRMESGIRQNHADDKVAIISDEIHEANLYTEIATGVAAKAVHEHDNWRLIAASATHNTASLQSSFYELNQGHVPSVTIEGRPFEVAISSVPIESPIDVYARIGDQHEKTMIFTSGKSEIDHSIEQIIHALEKQEKGSSLNVVFRKLHGELNDMELARVNDPVAADQRVVIVSSPAGMSGITIPGVTCVISDGTINRSELDDDKVPGLTRRYLSQAEVIQQMGRAGRDVAGGIGVLAAPITVVEDKLRARGQEIEVEQMPFIALDRRDEFGPPEIYHSNLSQVVLSVADIDRRFSEINPFIPHQVTSTDIISAEESLSRLGALNAEDTITQLGSKMNQFPVRPELSRGMVEVLKQQRSMQQLARAAFIVSALESGGVQDFSNKADRHWQQLLRVSTADDFMAQLDIMQTPMPDSPQEYVDFLDDYNLSYKRLERANKVTRKILRACGLRLENIVMSTPNINEEDELRHDLAAGLIDFTYQKTRVIDRQQQYQNIHSGQEAKQRTISPRSVVSSVDHDYVVGFPRWYDTAKKDGTRKRHNIVEQLMPVSPEVIVEYAAANELLTRGHVEPVLDGGQVIERYQLMFGSIPAGRRKSGVTYEDIPNQSQNLLVTHVLKTPGQAQQALREIADEIEYYRSRLPEGALSSYIRSDAPQLVTKAIIETLIRTIASTTRQAHEIDQQLGHHVFRQNVSIHRYFDDETRKFLQSITPNELMIDDQSFAVHYDKGIPYVICSRVATRTFLKDQQIRLPDGREVLVQITLPEQRKARVRTNEL